MEFTLEWKLNDKNEKAKMKLTKQEISDVVSKIKYSYDKRGKYKGKILNRFFCL